MKSKIFGYVCALFVISLMVFAAELSGEKEIIFPEVAALSVGAFITPRLVWKTNYIKILVSISVCALLGVLIVTHVPLPVWGQFSLTFLIGQIVLFVSRTTFAPLISAISLPVLIQTRSFVYVGAAVVLTIFVCFLSIVLEKLGAKEQNEYEPVVHESFRELFDIVFRCGAVFLLSFLCIHFDVRFCVAPPLLVAFTELSRKSSPALKRPFSVILLVFLCAFFGAVSRFFLCVKLGLPLTLAAFFVAICVLVLVRIFSFPFPPAAAMSILAMLIPESAVIFYPLQVLLGICVLVVLAFFWRKCAGEKIEAFENFRFSLPSIKN